jgi:L-asparaginase / beta-aspartyl-peptidase
MSDHRLFWNRKIFFLACCLAGFCLPAFLKAEAASSNITLVIHGGAGTILRDNMTPAREQEYSVKMQEALTAGYAVLKNGGSSLNAVETAIRILEDSPLFNAGKGAVFANDGTNQLDAAIMDGKTLKAGAAAGLRHIKNPISLARLIMEQSPHVMMAGEGAESFARLKGVELVPQEYFFTEPRWQELQKAKELEKPEPDGKKTSSATPSPAWNDLDKTGKNPSAGFHPSGDSGGINPSGAPEKFGTVGAVALDAAGNLAAGTSTGGMTNKKFGRIGDSPIIGAGTYANNKTCAVSATGHGEFFIRAVVGHDISALMEYKGLPVAEAARQVIMEKVTQLGGTGGGIALDSQGNFTMPFNTPGMYRGHISRDGKAVVEMYK